MINKDKFEAGKRLYLKLLSENRPGFVSFDKEVIALRIQKVKRYIERGKDNRGDLKKSLEDLVNLRYYLEMENNG
jgi:hypothetical protein